MDGNQLAAIIVICATVIILCVIVTAGEVSKNGKQ